MKTIATIIAALSFGIAGAASAQDRIATSEPGTSAMMPAATHRHSTEAVERRETTALNLLEAAGYGQYTDFTPEGRDYRATAMKDGERIAVRVDPDQGTVTPIR